MCNAHNALCNRHAIRPPDISVLGLALLVGAAVVLRRHAARLLVNLPELYLGVDEWLQRWSQVRRAAIARSLATELVLPDRVKSFVKRELHSHATGAAPTKARLIQGYATLATQERFARQFYGLQKSLFAEPFIDMGAGLTVTYASGMNPDQIGWWLGEAMARAGPGCSFYERDGKNWDSTMSLHHMVLKEQYYRLVPGLFEFAMACHDVKGVAGRGEFAIKYSLMGTTKSGHNDTSLGNSIVNAGIMLACAAHMDLRGHIIVAGDDALMVVAGGLDWSLARFTTLEAECGIIPEAGKFYDYRDVTFISLCFMRAESGDILAYPKPGRILARLGWTVRRVPRKLRPSYVRAVVLGMMGMYADTPLMKEFLDAMVRSVGWGPIDWRVLRYIDSYQVLQGWGLRRDRRVSEAELLRRYDLPDGCLRGLLKILSSIRGTGLLRHSVIDAVVAFDMSDAAARTPRQP